MNFISKIRKKEFDELVHIQFQKFSKGEFTNRALISVKKTKDKITISTTAEFANDLVKTIAQKAGSDSIEVSGAIVSTSDLKNDIEYKEIKQFQGVKRYLLDMKMTGNGLVKLLDEFPKAFFALSFKHGTDELKIKPKAPKSGKPSPKGEAPSKPDFCKLITFDNRIGEEFVFEKSDFKKADINHTFVIEDIIIPAELKKTNDFARMREESLRKGKIIRNAIIDEKSMNSTLEFEA